MRTSLVDVDAAPQKARRVGVPVAMGDVALFDTAPSVTHGVDWTPSFLRAAGHDRDRLGSLGHVRPQPPTARL